MFIRNTPQRKCKNKYSQATHLNLQISLLLLMNPDANSFGTVTVKLGNPSSSASCVSYNLFKLYKIKIVNQWNISLSKICKEKIVANHGIQFVLKKCKELNTCLIHLSLACSNQLKKKKYLIIHSETAKLGKSVLTFTYYKL